MSGQEQRTTSLCSSREICDGIPHCLAGEDEVLCNSGPCPLHCSCSGSYVTCEPANINLDLTDNGLKDICRSGMGFDMFDHLQQIYHLILSIRIFFKSQKYSYSGTERQSTKDDKRALQFPHAVQARHII